MGLMKKSPMELGRRERQIMAFIYRRGRATAAEVQEGIVDAPGYSGIRAMLRILEEKGHLVHEKIGNKYTYSATQSAEDAGQSALQYLVKSFYNGSAERAVAALLDMKNSDLSPEQVERLSIAIDKAKREGQ